MLSLLWGGGGYHCLPPCVYIDDSHYLILITIVYSISHIRKLTTFSLFILPLDAEGTHSRITEEQRCFYSKQTNNFCDEKSFFVEKVDRNLAETQLSKDSDEKLEVLQMEDYAPDLSYKNKEATLSEGHDDVEDPDKLPYTVTELKHPGGSSIYLVGTAHFSEESQNDVIKVRYNY